MQKTPQTVPATLPVDKLAGEFAKSNTHGLPVVDDEGLLYGLVTLQDWARAQDMPDKQKRIVGDICVRDLWTVTPTTQVADALKLIGLHQVGRLPVVERANSRHLVGLLRRRDIVQAYSLAVQRKQDAEQQALQLRLEAYSDARVFEVRVAPKSAAENHRIREINWPATTLIAAVRRQAEVIVPHGDLVLHAADTLVIVTTVEDLSELGEITKARPSPDKAAKRLPEQSG